jgi:hypothetical protein
MEGAGEIAPVLRKLEESWNDQEETPVTELLPISAAA